MHVAKEDVQVQLQVPGVTMRQGPEWGSVKGFDQLAGEFFSLAAGTDTTELFKGLKGDLCQCPHWGFVLKGRITTTDAKGAKETVKAHDLFYWPAGHNVMVEEDADLIMFSPRKEHAAVIQHLKQKTQG